MQEDENESWTRRSGRSQGLEPLSTEVVKEAEFCFQGVPFNLNISLNPSDLYNASIWSNVLRKPQ